MFKVKIERDSITNAGARITTFSLVYPRFIHSQFLTHRVFSRNSASSRAIPISKVIEEIKNNPAIPSYWGKNKNGMQAEEELSNSDKEYAIMEWRSAGNLMIDVARRLDKLGLHKQITNRILEPWQHISTIVTSTEWSNFAKLRVSDKAQPEFQKLAALMMTTLDKNEPLLLEKGEWHLPYITDIERHEFPEESLKWSVARCARVSYKNHEGIIDREKDSILYNNLLSNGHMSPFEHQATPASNASSCSANFKGWVQYRCLIDRALKETTNESPFYLPRTSPNV